MILNQAGLIFNLNNASNVYNSATGLWLSTNSSTPLNLEIAYANSVAGKFVKSSSVSNLPAGSNTESLYYIFQKTTAGVHYIGFASTYENAENKIPIIFTSAGDLFSFRQAGHSYALKPLFLECCDFETFDTQLPPPFNTDPNSPWEMPGPEKIRKKITFIISGVGVTGYVDSGFLNMGDINSFATIINGTYDLYVSNGAYGFTGVTGDYTGTYPKTKLDAGYFGGPWPFILYNNQKTKYDNLYVSVINAFFKISLLLNVSTLEVTATYEISLEGFADAGYNVMGATYRGSIVFTNFASISAGDVFDTIPTLNLVSSSGYFGPWPATISPVFTGDYEDELLPETITLEKTYESARETKLEILGTAYPTRGWTTNDYTADLPDTITLTKTGDRNYESDPITFAVNLINKVRLKLMVLPSDLFGVGYFGYVFYDRYARCYRSPIRAFRFFNTPAPNYYDGSLLYTGPAGITSSVVDFDLFSMSGILAQNASGPTAPDASSCFASVKYKINVGGPPYIPLRTDAFTFVSHTGGGGFNYSGHGLSEYDSTSGFGSIPAGTTQTVTFTALLSGVLNYSFSVADFGGTPTASISVGGTVIRSLTGISNYTGTHSVTAGQTIVLTFAATAINGNFSFAMYIP
jgi:hypothetical protein